MANNTVRVLNEATGTYYTVTVTVESTVISSSNTGIESYYFRVSTAVKDSEGRSIPDQIVQPTDDFTDAINLALQLIQDRVAGTHAYVTSSSSSSSTKISVSSSTSESSMSLSTASSASSSSTLASLTS